MMNYWLAKLLVVIAISGGVSYGALTEAQPLKKPIEAQLLKKEPAQLSCGQKVLVENNTCPPGQVLEVTGSCLSTKPAIDTTARGLQYNCIKRN
jgi:Family of unknown function (DUF6719)